ncbi:MAG: hypothetical protein JWM78_1550 [Verrucomicrobiaceae bacterium]|nr:hypothetical protein [Verrucomicrobiaceae bacterium]
MFIAAGVASSPVFAASVEVQALMADAALLKIDGQQHMLRNGQRSPEGVLLVSADPRHALVEIDGKRTSLTLSQRIAGSFAESDQTEVRIERNARQQYLTSAEINGRRTMVAVDTGANVVAISGDEARSMGIDYKKIGVPSQVTTASGVHSAYRVQLDKVVVGGIAINFVQATIIDGSFPETVLLGMTYLQHVGMREDNGVMYLRQKY